MKTRITLFLLVLLLLNQGCTVYQKTTISLSEASGKGKVKVISKSGKVFRFYDLKLEDGVYYGLAKNNVLNERGRYKLIEYYVPLTEAQIVGVYPMDPKKSKRRTILAATSPLIIIGSYYLIIIILLALGVISIV